MPVSRSGSAAVAPTSLYGITRTRRRSGAKDPIPCFIVSALSILQ